MSSEEYDWIFNFVLQFLESDLFDTAIMNFVDDKCVSFDDEDENKFIYTEIHNEFREHIENVISSNLGELGVTPEIFYEACEFGRHTRDINRTVFDKIIAMDDFLTFKNIMVKRNMELELEYIRSYRSIMELDTFPNSEDFDNYEAALKSSLSKPLDPLPDPEELEEMGAQREEEVASSGPITEEEMQSIIRNSFYEMELLQKQQRRISLAVEEAEEVRKRQVEEERKKQVEAVEVRKRQVEAEEKSKQDRILLLLSQQKYLLGDRVIIGNSNTGSDTAGAFPCAPPATMSGLLEPEGDVGVVLEYKIEGLEASYVVRVVSGGRKDQVVSYSPDSLTSYSDAMCQRLGLDDLLFGKYYDRTLLSIQTLTLRELTAEMKTAKAKKQAARIRELSSAIKAVYVYKETDLIPAEEVNSYLASLTNDFDARFDMLIEDECYETAELCETTKNALLQYYHGVYGSSVSNHSCTSDCDDEEGESAELFTFLKDSCHVGYNKARHYSDLMYSKHGIDSIKNLKLRHRKGILRSTLSEFISSEEVIASIETEISRLLSNTVSSSSSSSSPIIARSSRETSAQSVSPSPSAPSTSAYTADGKPILDVRPLSESLDRDSANHIAYSGIFTGHFLQVTGRVDVVIKVGDGRRDLAAEERMLRALRDSCAEAVALGVIRLIDHCPASASRPPYLVLEKYGEDIRPFFKSPAAANDFKKYLVNLLQAVDSIHRVGIMHGDIKPQNILFRHAIGHSGIKLCDFENACTIGQVIHVSKYTKAWVSPEVYWAAEEGRGIRASAAVDVFSLGLILGALFDGNCYADKTVLPADHSEDFQRAFRDQDYLNSLLPCNMTHTYQPWIHAMCRLDPTQRCSVDSMIRSLQENTTTNLVNQNKYLKVNIETNLVTINNKLDLILERVTSGFESLKCNLRDLIQTSFENILNNTNDENNILQKLLIATEYCSQRLKGSNGTDSSSGRDRNNVTLSEAKEGLSRMEAAIRVAIESQMSGYEEDRRREMAELQTSVLTRCRDLEAVLRDQSSDSKNLSATLTAISQSTELLHKDLLEVRKELVSMKGSLLQLAEATRSIVASNDELRVSVDRLDVGLHRMGKSDLKEYQELNKSLESLHVAMELTPSIASSLQSVVNETNSLLLTLLKGVYDIPTLVILLPEIAHGVTSFLRNPSRLFSDSYRLFFVCSHTLCIAPCGPKGRGYPLSVTKEWVKKASPVLKVGLVAVKLALATSGVPFPISDLLKGLNISAQADYFDAALQNLQNISTSTVTVAETQLEALTKEDCLSFLDRNAEGTRVAYEGIKEMLKNHTNFISNCGLVFVEYNGKVAWVLPGQEENWRLALGAR